jgi:hypothetical protein
VSDSVASSPGADAQLVRARLRTPRAAGVAGVAFALLLGTALVLITLSSPSNPARVGQWLTQSSRRDTISLALNLVPFAGIAFLWFIGVVRDRIGQHEDRFFSTVFLGSGLLFVAMIFAAAAIAGGLLIEASSAGGDPLAPSTLALGRKVTGLFLNTYAMRMAAVFTLSTATIVLRTGVLARWIALVGIAVALVLFTSVTLTPWVELLFPAWILVVSVAILSSGLRAVNATDG